MAKGPTFGRLTSISKAFLIKVVRYRAGWLFEIEFIMVSLKIIRGMAREWHLMKEKLIRENGEKVGEMDRGFCGIKEAICSKEDGWRVGNQGREFSKPKISVFLVTGTMMSLMVLPRSDIIMVIYTKASIGTVKKQDKVNICLRRALVSKDCLPKIIWRKVFLSIPTDHTMMGKSVHLQEGTAKESTCIRMGTDTQESGLKEKDMAMEDFNPMNRLMKVSGSKDWDMGRWKCTVTHQKSKKLLSLIEMFKSRGNEYLFWYLQFSIFL